MISHAPPDYQCPFCLLVDGVENTHVYTTQNEIILQTDRITAFVASHQWRGNAPNILVIPNQHYENVYTLPADYGNDIQKGISKVAWGLKAIYNCAGVSTRQHNEPAGSQDVWHYHVHVTPRFKNDRFYLRSSFFRRMMPLEQRLEYAVQLKNFLSKNPKTIYPHDKRSV